MSRSEVKKTGRPSISCIFSQKPHIIRLFLLLAAMLFAAACNQSSVQQQPEISKPQEAPPSARANPGLSAEENTEIARTLERISRGEQRYRQDGSVFQNREKRLPLKAGGYYKEYTVETPASETRGARRIVVGKGGEIYYTSDHYRSFLRLDAKDYN